MLDKETGDPIQFASVSLVDSKGKNLGFGTMTDKFGAFTLNNSILDREDVFVEITAVGYAKQSFTPEEFSAYDDTVRLDPTAKEMENVVITYTKKKVDQIKKSNYALPIGLASAAVITFGIYFYIR